MPAETIPTEIPASMQMMQLLWPGALVVQAIHAAAVLGIADLLAGGPKTVDQLAAATNTDRQSLARLLRGLASLGIFRTAIGNVQYDQTPLSDVLRTDHPASLRPWALMLGAEFVSRPTAALTSAIRTGRPAFHQVFGTSLFEHLAEHPEDSTVFDRAMSSLPAYTAAVVGAYDFSQFERVVDVGGGRGALLTAILAANPLLRGVLYDLPAVTRGAPAPPPSVAGRMDIVAGDFFASVPAGGDAYVLSGVIHDWNDERAVAILKNCRQAMLAGGRLLICDVVLTTASDPARAMMDLLMLVLTGGRERTEEEFRALLRDSGFALKSVRATAMGGSVLEALPV